MTINEQTPSVTYAGNDATTSFSFSFAVSGSDQIDVYYTGTDGSTSRIDPSLYTVTLTPIPSGELWYPGGSVIYPISGSPIETGTSLVILRTQAYDQDTSISNQGSFYPRAIEQALDLLSMQIQQVENQINYTIAAETSEPAALDRLPSAVDRANGFLAFDSDGQPMIAGSTGGLGSGTVTSVSLTVPDILTTTGSPITTSGTLAIDVADQDANTVWSGPTTGGADAPAFRALVAADLPVATSSAFGTVKPDNTTITVSAGVLTSVETHLGTVTSVALSLDSGLYTVTGSPVTSSGTLTGTLGTRAQNTVFAGPTSGADAKPTFRALVTADLPAGVGTVTSVGLTMPAIMSVGGSPITSSGNLAVTLATQSANVVWAGPTTGGATTPTFRALVTADMPAGTGTVTSVALTVPSILSIAGSPITTSGTLAITLATETANTIFAGPTTGGAVAPTFRALVGADISGLSANPSATAGPSAVNGSAATYMRSDGAPAIQLATSGQKGLVQVDGTTITASSGVISVVGTGVHSGFAVWGFHPLYYGVAGISVANALPANGGSLLCPISVNAPMSLQGISFRNTDTTLARSIEWGLYLDTNVNATANLVTGAQGTASWTAAAASTIDSACNSPPIALNQGMYWLVLRNTHASNTCGVGSASATASLVPTFVKNQTLGSSLTSTLDLNTGWLTALFGNALPAVRLNGRVLGQTALWS